MKRLFYLLTILLNAHYLLAQNQSPSNESLKTGGVHQVTGCRLQVVGSNQTTENQIRQQAEPTTNCYLMMEPEAMEEVAKNLKKELGISEENIFQEERASAFSSSRVGEHSEFTLTSTNSTSVSKSHLLWGKALVAARRADRASVLAKNLPSQSTEAAMAFVTPVLEQIVSSPSTTTCKDSMNAALDLNFDLDSMKHTALHQNFSSALPHQVFTSSRNDGDEISAPESSGMPYTFRPLCSETPCPSSVSATLKTGSNTNQIESAYNEVIGIAQDASNAWVDAAEAKKVVLSDASEADKPHLITKINTAINNKELYDQLVKEKAQLIADYREVAIIFQRVADYKKLAAERKASRKESEGTKWYNAACSLQAVADYQTKALETQELGKLQLAAGYREAATTSQRAADQWKLSAEATLDEKKSQNDCNNLGFVGESLQTKADYQAKASEAQDEGKNDLAKGYLEVITIFQKAEDLLLVAERMHAAGEAVKADCCRRESLPLQAKANYLAKASEAHEVGKEQLAAGYREAAATSQRAADQRKLATIADDSRKVFESHSWEMEAQSLQKKANYQAKASEAQNAEKEELSVGYREAAAMSQRAADQCKLAAQTHIAGKKEEGFCWDREAQSLQKKANYQAKMSEAEEAGKTMLAAGYQEAITILQGAADQSKESALAKSLGKEKEGNGWSSVAFSLQSQADCQVKAIEAQDAGKTTATDAYREAGKTSQDAADHYKQSALASASGRERESTYWDWAGKSLDSKVYCQENAGVAEEIEQTTLVASYFKEAAAIYQRAADQYKQAAEACAAGNSNEDIITRLFNAGKATGAKAETIRKKALHIAWKF